MVNSPATQPPLVPVPWTKRDVWIGMGCLGIWIVLMAAVQLLLYRLEVNVDFGVSLTFSEALLVLPAWFLGVRKYRAPWSTLGLRRFKFEFVMMGLGLLIVSYIFNAFYNLLVLMPLGVVMQSDIKNALGQVSWSVWLWLGGTIVGPFVEEVFFRGFIHGGLRKYFNWKVAAAISAGLFSLVHLDWTAILPIFILGYFLAFLYEKSRSIWPGIIVHVITNALGFAIAYLLY